MSPWNVKTKYLSRCFLDNVCWQQSLIKQEENVKLVSSKSYFTKYSWINIETLNIYI